MAPSFSAFKAERHVQDMTDSELLDQLLRMAPWWRASTEERVPIRTEILRRMRARGLECNAGGEK